MSKFFRSVSSASSSSTASEGETDEVSRARNGNTKDASAELATALTGLNVTTSPTTDHGWHSQMLLHALLEERCLNEVLRETPDRRGRPRDDAAIRAEATTRYQRMCMALAPHNLISSGLENDSLSPTRQRYRDGLDILSRTTTTPQRPSVPAPLRRLLTESDAPPLSPSAHCSGTSVDSASTLTPIHPVLEPSRYNREFEELAVLGKGGYGVVYQARHRLDNVDYAVKKVPISASRMNRIRTNGQRELDDLLREVRTLARLDHPNIVRYFAGWIEWSDVDSFPRRQMSLPSDSGMSDASVSGTWDQSEVLPHADDDMPSLRRVVTQSGSEDVGVVFEQSTSNVTQASQDSPESIEQATAQFHGNTHMTSRPQPALALHVQMGLYPLNLADFISPPSAFSDSTIATMQHCFHLQPSIAILLALLDGAEYLHSEGIVHRDLKPANIFLAANSDPRSTRGSVDLFLCKACRDEGQAQPIKLNVRIGDFGLVTAIADSSSEAPVGTALYQPIHATLSASPSLDIFALGIIAFELLWPFSTRMERHDTLSRIKRGDFPAAFEKRYSGVGLLECIGEMLSMRHERADIAELKRRLEEVLESSDVRPS